MFTYSQQSEICANLELPALELVAEALEVLVGVLWELVRERLCLERVQLVHRTLYL